MRAEIANLDGPLRQWATMAAQIRDQAKAAEIDTLKENSDFNLPNIHFLEHLAKHISSYGYLGQYSTEISEWAHMKRIKEWWRKSTHVDTMKQILKYGDNYCSMKTKAEIATSTTEPEPARPRDYPRFCGKQAKRYKHVATLSSQIDVLQLQTLLARYLKLDEGVVYDCCIRVWKSL